MYTNIYTYIYICVPIGSILCIWAQHNPVGMWVGHVTQLMQCYIDVQNVSSSDGMHAMFQPNG